MNRTGLVHLIVLTALGTALLSQASPIPSARAQATRYALALIPAPYAKGLNDQGQAVGYDGWMWDRGRFTILDRMGGVSISANGINNKGQIVGNVTLRRGARGHLRAVLWDGGRVTDLGTLGGQGSYANAINDVGQVVGWSNTSSGEMHAFLWENGKMSDLGTLPGDGRSVAWSINAKGQVVGDSGLSTRHAFLWQGGAMQDLSPAIGNWSEAKRINNLGQVVGIGHNHRCFLWENGAVRTFGPQGEQCIAEGINDNGRVVGWVPGKGGFLWDHGKMQYLSQLIPAGILRFPGDGSARAINNRGQILLHIGNRSALLTPAP